MVDVIAECEKNGTEAEKALIAACREGEECILNGGKLPEVGADDVLTIRAALIRALAIEATSQHETGAWLEGAVISGSLDLSFAKCRGRLVLHNCRFADEPQMAQTELAQLSLDGSHLPGLFAQGARVTGDVFLSRVTATGTVVMAGAEIGGQLSCIGATLNGGAGDALNAQGAKVTGSVFLRAVTATGTVDVNSAEIGGQLSCSGATLNGGTGKALNAQGAKVTGSMILNDVTATGTVDVNSVQIGGQLSCIGATLNGGAGVALRGQSLRVADGFLFRRIKAVTGRVNLASAHVGDLVDDGASWDMCEDVILDGFTYDRIGGGASPKSFAARKNWLAKGSRAGAEFRPQPYTQFAKVMRAAGHLGEARKALAARDTIQFKEAEIEDREAFLAAYQYGVPVKSDSGMIWLRLHGRRVWAGLSRRVIGHGHHPQYALFWSLAFWGLGALLYGLAYSAGLMVPNSDVIMVSAEWLAAVEMRPTAPTELWADSALASKHYETFYSWIYALDVFLPLVDFGQESTWAATTTTNWGKALRAMTFLYQIAGWVVTSLGLAAITGFVQRNSPD